MTAPLFKEVHYTFGNLISDIDQGGIGLSDIQRPFFLANATMRDLFDSTYHYDEFLTVRRPLIARVIGAGYEKLTGDIA